MGLVDLALVADAVTPGTLAADRTLPVTAAWQTVLPDGLVRGRSLACTGLGAPSLALSLLAGALDTGAWLAVIDLPWLGVEAARDLGVPLERIVRIDTARTGGDGDGTGELWAEVLAAASDGFDCILTRVPRRLPAGLVRRIGTRLRQRGTILVALGEPGPLSPDLTVSADSLRWDGLDEGHGHLRRRRLEATIAGRRMPRSRRVPLDLPAADGGTTATLPEPTALRPRIGAG